MRKISHLTPRRDQLALVFLALILIGIAVVGSSVATYLHVRTVTVPGGALPPLPTGNALPRSEPTRLRIPSIGVDAPFVRLGVMPNREVETPSSTTEVGWYAYGPTPGELGPAVVIGHVDSRLGPGVFYSLGQLKPGDTIEAVRQDGSVATFRVDRLEHHEQGSFPTEEVYGDLPYAGLRLITCSGTYDRESRRYDFNLIVFASLVEDGAAER